MSDEDKDVKKAMFDRLQAEQAPWVLKNFGDRPASQPARGIVEELGEFMEARLGTDADRDAIADVVIFMADLCTARGKKLSSIAESGDAVAFNPSGLLTQAGRLMHHDLKLEQGIRGNEEEHVGGIMLAVSVIYSMLLDYCSLSRYPTPIEIAIEVWDREVKHRDWGKERADRRAAELIAAAEHALEFVWTRAPGIDGLPSNARDRLYAAIDEMKKGGDK